ncbi:GerAB/ArcD/ProY family transporter [Anaerobranca gottschalkii]|uniref:Spore germination protein (Amino acid permease) n=1 Tax=Anaerobranca gottschalkii DSM 13577 TaxID=1120990 RepID=A0A1H9YID4_9FIRM|nr:endospore germination permease [Anaerobranca gottschalkii]SES68816.1 spore germination protein (amino acid permease) [Anaerobranca gottschalkii DSM 13577]
MSKNGIDKTKISLFQIFLLTLAQSGGAVIMYLPGSKEANNDVWISFLLASLFGYIVIFCNYLPLSISPEKCFTKTIIKFWGKFLGTFVILYYFLFFYLLANLILSDIYYFGKIVMPETPPYVFIIFFLTPAIYSLKLGVETLARFCEFLIPILIVVYCFLHMLIIPNLELSKLLPIMAKGIGPVLEGAIPNMNFPFAQLLPIIFFYKYTITDNNSKKYLKYVFIAIILSTLLLSIRTIVSVTAFDPYIMENITYPPYSAVRLIQIGEVLERVDALYIAIFYGTTYLKFTITYFVLCQIICDYFNTGEIKDFAVPMAVLIGVSMPFLIPRFDIILKSVVPLFYLFFPIFTIIPLLLYLTVKIKDKNKKRKTNKTKGSNDSLH